MSLEETEAVRDRARVDGHAHSQTDEPTLKIVDRAAAAAGHELPNHRGHHRPNRCRGNDRSQAGQEERA